MPTKPDRRAKPFIPYTSLYVGVEGDSDIWLHYVWCSKDRSHYVFKATLERGLSDYEKIQCPDCGGELFKYEGGDSAISSTTIPEPILCLTRYDGKTLLLGRSKYASETEVSASVRLLESLNTLKSPFQVGEFFQDKSFQAALKSLKSKNIFNSSSISWSKHKRREEKLRERDTRNVDESSVRPSELVKQNERLSKSYLEQLEGAWLSYEARIKQLEQGTADPKLFLKEKPKAKKSSTLSAKRISITRLKHLSDSLMIETLSESKFPEFSVHRVKAALYRLVPLTEKK